MRAKASYIVVDIAESGHPGLLSEFSFLALPMRQCPAPLQYSKHAFFRGQHEAHYFKASGHHFVVEGVWPGVGGEDR